MYEIWRTDILHLSLLKSASIKQSCKVDDDKQEMPPPGSKGSENVLNQSWESFCNCRLEELLGCRRNLPVAAFKIILIRQIHALWSQQPSLTSDLFTHYPDSSRTFIRRAVGSAEAKTSSSHPYILQWEFVLFVFLRLSWVEA